MLQHMVNNPKKKLFTNDELGKEIRMDGRALGGILGVFSKRENEEPLIMKAGMIMTGWRGEKFNRPKQVWTINPKLSNEELFQIKESLNNLRLEL